MNSQLAFDKDHLNDILRKTVSLAEGHFARSEEIAPGRFIPDMPLTELPENGIGASAVLDYFEKKFARQMANSAGPRYFGFVTGGATPASVAGDWLVSTYDQNACGSNDSIAPQIERQTIHFFRQLFGLSDSWFGSFVTGATQSNLVGLALGRQWVGDELGIDISQEGFPQGAVRVISATPHSSVIKSLAILGIGRNALVKLPTEPDREAVDITALENYFHENPGPVIVVANAGTVNTVDFDNLKAIVNLKEKYNFWLHVDAAFGGFAAVSPRFAHLMQGIDRADSLTIDAHKWLNVPYDAAMQFTRHRNIQLKVFQNSAAYLGDPATSPDYFHYTPENSRRFRALPSWFTLMAYGRKGYEEIIERNCEAATILGNLINGSENFRLLAPVRMNVVCFTLETNLLDPARVRNFLNAVRDDGRVFFTPTVYKGVPSIRAAISNWQTISDDVRIAFSVLTEVWERMKSRIETPTSHKTE